MNQAEKHQNESSIRFGSLLSSAQSKTLSKENESHPYDNLNSHVLSLSHQVEDLMDKTSRLLNKPHEKQAFQWNVLFWVVALAITIGLFSFIYLNHQQKEFKNELSRKINLQQNNLDRQLKSQTQDTQANIALIEDRHRKHKDFTLDKIHAVERSLNHQSDRLNQLNTQLSQHQGRLTELNQRLVATELKIDTSLKKMFSQPMETKQSQELASKLSNWEQSQKNVQEQRVKSALDRYERRFVNNSGSSSRTIPEAVATPISERNRTYANAYAKIAWKESQKGQTQKAILTYRKALTYNPSLGMAYYNLACLYAKKGHTEQATQWLKQGRPYFSEQLLETALLDKDLINLREDPYFRFLMS